MMQNKSPRTPKYRRQRRAKGRDVAFAELAGKRVYLGAFDSPGSHEAFGRVLAEWNTNGHRAPISVPDLAITEMAAAFMQHAEGHYRRLVDGEQTSEVDTFRRVLGLLVRMYGSTAAEAFGPKALRAVRGEMIHLGWVRTSVNRNVGRVRAIFRWGVEHELVDSNILHALQALSPLKRGRCDAKESIPKRPIPEAHIEAIREHVSRQVWALVQLQLLTGARPGELVGLRAVDINTGGAVWTFAPLCHKTAHHGCERTIFFGPKAQGILREFMADRPVDKPLFSPREAEDERHAAAPTHRRPDQRPNPKTTDRELGEAYDVAAYRRSIERACGQAKVPTWSPHRLRHTAATRLRTECGLDTVQTILGHKVGSAITELYAEPNVRRAMQVIAAVG